MRINPDLVYERITYLVTGARTNSNIILFDNDLKQIASESVMTDAYGDRDSKRLARQLW